MSSPTGLDLLSAAIHCSCMADLPSAPASSTSPSASLVTLNSEASTKDDTVAHQAIPANAHEESPSLSSLIVASNHEVIAHEESQENSHNRAKTFPEILRDILSNPDHAPIASWTPSGNSFAIHDTRRFSSIILPKYFRRAIFRSFVRKLNRWGFRSVRRVSGFECAFEHGMFLRDFPDLSCRMNHSSNPSSGKSGAAAAALRGISQIGGINQIAPTLVPSYGAFSMAYSAAHQVPRVTPFANFNEMMLPNKMQKYPTKPPSLDHQLGLASLARSYDVANPALVSHTQLVPQVAPSAQVESLTGISLQKEEFRLGNELLLLRELRQQALMSHIQQAATVQAQTEAEVNNNLSQFIATQQQLLHLRQKHGGL